MNKTARDRLSFSSALALSFLIPCLILIAVFKTLGFYPFGIRSLLVVDMYHQYSLYYQSLWQIMSGDSSIFFSWSKSMGSNYIGLFAYYLSSPLMFILFLFGQENVQSAVSCLTILKISLCGLTSFICFTYIFSRKSFSILVFSTSYALMPYNIVYSHNLMWLDACILLPVILMGAEKILRNERPYIFIISICLMFVANYYIACMAGIFCALFIICRYLIVSTDFCVYSFLKTILKFALFALIAIGMASWILFPALSDLTMGKIGFDNFTSGKLANFSLSDYILSFSPQTYTTLKNKSSLTNHSGIPFLYCGLVVIILCAIFFAVKSVTPKEKIITLLLFVVMLSSFFFTKLDNAWHGFVSPNWFPYRYSFTFQFLLVFTACNMFMIFWKEFGNVINEKMNFLPKSILLTRKSMKLTAAVMVILIMSFVCFDLYGNTKVLISGVDVEFGYRHLTERTYFRNENLPLVQYIKNHDDSFYRLEKTYEQTVNDALGLGYKGVSHSSSTFLRNLLDFSRQVGLSQWDFKIRYFGSSILTDSIFNIKYIMSEREMSEYYNKLIVHGNITVYQNPYALPLGFIVDKNARYINIESLNYFENQNNILNGFRGKDTVYFKKIEDVQKGSGENLEYSFTAENNFPMYFSIPSPCEKMAIDQYGVENDRHHLLYINGDEHTTSYFTCTNNHVVYIGQFEPGTEINIAFSVGRTDYELLGEHFYYLDMDEFEKAVQELNEGGLYNIRYKNSHIKAEVNAPSGGLMFTSIPYNKGFTVKLNGKKVPYEALCDTFIAFAVDEGRHFIEITFIPRGFVTGLCVSVISLLSMLVLILRPFWSLRK